MGKGKRSRPGGSAESRLAGLQSRLRAKLAGSEFRWLNERLYTQPGAVSLSAFQREPELFAKYHQGFREQVARWPVNPLDVMVRKVSELPRSAVIADMGCGEAKLAASVPHKVHSFDLVAANERITAADIADVPLPDASVDCVVFCLALMGTDYASFLVEAARICKPGGILHVAEVRSRVEGAGSTEEEADPTAEARAESAPRLRTKLSEDEAAAGLSAFIDTIQEAGFAVRRVNRRNKMFLLVQAVRLDDGKGGCERPKAVTRVETRSEPFAAGPAAVTGGEGRSEASSGEARGATAGATSKPGGAPTGRSDATRIARATKRRDRRRAARAASGGGVHAAGALEVVASGSEALLQPASGADLAPTVSKAGTRLKACVYKRR